MERSESHMYDVHIIGAIWLCYIFVMKSYSKYKQPINACRTEVVQIQKYARSSKKLELSNVK